MRVMREAQHTTTSSGFETSLVDGRMHQIACAARGQLARWLSDLTEFLRRQPLDRYWPPHP